METRISSERKGSGLCVHAVSFELGRVFGVDQVKLIHALPPAFLVLRLRIVLYRQADFLHLGGP